MEDEWVPHPTEEGWEFNIRSSQVRRCRVCVVKPDGCGGVRVIDKPVDYTMSAKTARAFAAQLIAAANEAETVPRFSEDDLEAIESVLLDRMHARCSEHSDCLDALRALRKPRP